MPEQGQQANNPNNSSQGSNNLNAPGFNPPYFPMSDFDGGEATQDSSIGFDDDSGSLQLNFLNRMRGQQPEQRVIDEAGQQQVRDAQPNVYEDRFTKLENTILQQQNAMQQMVAIMAGYMQGNNQIQPEAEPQYDLSDAGQLTKFMDHKIQSSIGAALKPIMDILPQMAARISQFDASSRYGKEYADMLPPIQQLVQAAPNLSHDQAFQILSGVKKTTPGTPEAPKIDKPQGTAEQLQKLVQSVQTERGVNPGLKGKPEVKTLRDALNAAKLELYGH